MKKSKKKRKETDILDLSEGIFREIFKCLEEYEVYSNLRIICQTLKKYVDGYIQLQETFLVAQDLHKHERCRASPDDKINYVRLLYVFRKTFGNISLFIKSFAPTPPCPSISISKSCKHFHDSTFVLVHTGKVIFSSICHYQKPFDMLSNMLVYEYNEKQEEWYQIQECRIEFLDFTSKLVSGRWMDHDYFITGGNGIKLFRLSKTDEIGGSSVGNSQPSVPAQNNNIFHSFEVLDVSSVEIGSHFCKPYYPDKNFQGLYYSGEGSLIQSGKSELILVKPSFLKNVAHGISTMEIWNGVLTEETKPKLLW